MSAKALDLEAAQAALGAKLIANGKGTQALHDTVVAYQANRRAGTHATLTKATVNRSGKKPWRQKGTGNARAGYASSPVWRGGGVVFGPQPRDYSKTVSKKVRKLALNKALSEAAKSKRLFSVATFSLKSSKTRELVAWIKENQLQENLLIVTDSVNQSAVLASRNLPKVSVINAADVNAEQILTYKQIIIAEDAYPTLTNRLK
ncbi:MAG: 50S ribosomal protein L4 [Verrucomicrobiales bacterium]|jgi:large subunit ribosomal protein L4|nr:50S ribosomal protein L4 [Verrucomicrobiales bacterium]